MSGLLVMVTTPPEVRRLVLVDSDDHGRAILATMAALNTDASEKVTVVGVVEDAVLAAFHVPPNGARLAF